MNQSNESKKSDELFSKESSEPLSKELLISLALDKGADKTAYVKTENINFSVQFKEMCASNRCGKYNTNWMCPPAVGEIDDGIARVKSFEGGIIVQTITQLEDSFDFEGMQDAAVRHKSVFQNIIDSIKIDYPCRTFLPLGVGGCSLCDRCAYLDGNPCIRPGDALASVEAYGIDVNNLLTIAGLKYNNGPSTVSYVGLILF